eukprot:scaffold31886_cov66-Attheya_sp.AAC.4
MAVKPGTRLYEKTTPTASYLGIEPRSTATKRRQLNRLNQPTPWATDIKLAKAAAKKARTADKLKHHEDKVAKCTADKAACKVALTKVKSSDIPAKHLNPNDPNPNSNSLATPIKNNTYDEHTKEEELEHTNDPNPVNEALEADAPKDTNDDTLGGIPKSLEPVDTFCFKNVPPLPQNAKPSKHKLLADPSTTTKASA